MDLHEALKKHRLLAQLTQQQMADKLGIDKSTYAHYESGRRTPDAKKYLEIASILQIPLFPIKAKVTYPEGLLDSLDEVIRKYGEYTDDFRENKRRFEAISKVLNEVIAIRNEAMSISELCLSDLPTDTTLMVVNLDLRGEHLIDKAIKCTHEIIEHYYPK